MEASDSSPLSSPPPSDEEPPPPKPVLRLVKGKLTTSKKRKSPSTSPEPDLTLLSRDPSPPREPSLADNPDIGFIVMFRSRFHNAFPKTVPNLGPQDIENGVSGPSPSEQVEHLLCGLLGLVLNRKKYVERGHHGRALEEAISTNKNQWPPSWNGVNPLSGSKSFDSMNAEQRLELLRALILWSLNSSEQVTTMLKESYKQSRHDDDLNQPLFVPPWGTDSVKRNFYLIEGQTDTPFRIYREADRKSGKPTWRSVASTIEEAQNLARDLRAEKGQTAHRLAGKIQSAIPLLEERHEKRRRKEYRQARKAQFTRPEPGFSLYEGRTRGKRMRYTFDDDEDEGTDATSNRRSGRQTRTSTPAEGPTFTTSGRQVRSRYGRSYGESSRNLRGSAGDTSGRGSSANDEDELAGSDGQMAPRGDGRARRSSTHVNGKTQEGRHMEGYNSVDAMDSESEGSSSGEEWNGDDNDFEGKMDEDEDEEMSDVDDDSLGEDGLTTGSKVVTLKIGKEGYNALNAATATATSTSTSTNAQKEESPDPLAEDDGQSNQNQVKSTGTSFKPIAQPQPSSTENHAATSISPTSPQENNIILGTSNSRRSSLQAKPEVFSAPQNTLPTSHAVSPGKPTFQTPAEKEGQPAPQTAANGTSGHLNTLPNGISGDTSALGTGGASEPAVPSAATSSDPIQGGESRMNGA